MLRSPYLWAAIEMLCIYHLLKILSLFSLDSIMPVYNLIFFMDKEKNKCVCMNSLISETIWARAVQFSDNACMYCSYSLYILELIHALFRLHKSIKI